MGVIRTSCSLLFVFFCYYRCISTDILYEPESNLSKYYICKVLYGVPAQAARDEEHQVLDLVQHTPEGRRDESNGPLRARAQPHLRHPGAVTPPPHEQRRCCVCSGQLSSTSRVSDFVLVLLHLQISHVFTLLVPLLLTATTVHFRSVQLPSTLSLLSRCATATAAPTCPWCHGHLRLSHNVLVLLLQTVYHVLHDAIALRREPRTRASCSSKSRLSTPSRRWSRARATTGATTGTSAPSPCLARSSSVLCVHSARSIVICTTRTTAR